MRKDEMGREEEMDMRLGEQEEQGEKTFERRKFLKLGGALAVTGAAGLALPKSLGAQDLEFDDLEIKEGEDILVDARMIVDAMDTMTQQLEGPSDGLKAELGEHLAFVGSALKAKDGDSAIEGLKAYRKMVSGHLDELNASNGGLKIDGLAGGNAAGGIGDGLLAVSNFLIELGPGIIFFLVVILWARLLWILRCMIRFAICLGLAQNFFNACLALCAVFFAIPGPLGAAMAGACAVVCRGLTAAFIRLCIRNFIVCLAAC